MINGHAARPCSPQSVSNCGAESVDSRRVQVLASFPAARFNHDFSDGHREVGLTDDSERQLGRLAETDRTIMDKGHLRPEVVAGPLRVVALDPLFARLDKSADLLDPRFHPVEISNDFLGLCDLLTESPLLADEECQLAFVGGQSVCFSHAAKIDGLGPDRQWALGAFAGKGRSFPLKHQA